MDKFRKRLNNLRKQPKKPSINAQKKIPKLSLCTTCKGREHHLEKTIHHNIKLVREFDLEWIILDYDSPGDLKSLTAKYPEITYIRINNKPVFHMSNAKNLAHRAATGVMLLNVDADNFLRRKTIEEILQLKANCVYFNRKYLRGQIAMSRKNFHKLGGYDENFVGWGHEDTDFKNRALKAGLRHINIDVVKRIKHDNSERDEFLNLPFEITKLRNKILLSSKIDNRLVVGRKTGLGDSICALTAARIFARSNPNVDVYFKGIRDVVLAFGDNLIKPADNMKHINLKAEYLMRHKCATNLIGCFVRLLGIPDRIYKPELPKVEPFIKGPYIAFQQWSSYAKNPSSQFLKDLINRYQGQKIIAVGKIKTEEFKGVDYSYISGNILNFLSIICFADLVLSPRSISAHLAVGYERKLIMWSPRDGEDWLHNYDYDKQEIIYDQ